MDITSLLNASSAGKLEAEATSNHSPTMSSITIVAAVYPTVESFPAIEKGTSNETSGYWYLNPGRSRSRSRSRSRIPWDAGDHILPRTLDARPPRYPSWIVADNHWDGDSDVPISSRHRLSDSYSSLSSYEGLPKPISHSRLSSMSTVSGYQSSGAFSDMALEAGVCDNIIEIGRSHSNRGEPPNSISAYTTTRDITRSRSPSDAILIFRRRQGSDWTALQDTAK
jgi:hypothetical protein